MRKTASVTVVQTCKQQEALAAVHTHGSKFFVTGGKHITSNDMFKAAEIRRQKATVGKREKDKKHCMEYTMQGTGNAPNP